MLNFGNKEFRNLQEQVLKNMNDIQDIEEGATVLAEFGIKVVGQVETAEELPDPTTYEGDYGDAYLVGTGTPYNYYIFTRAFEGQENPSWFNLGIFPQPGPRGEQGEQGESGVTPVIGATVGSTSTLQPGQPATASVSVSGTAEQPTMTFSFAIPQGAQGIQGPQGATGPQGPQGQKGDKGDKGEQGGLIEIVGIVATESDLPSPATLQKLDAAYLVGSGTYYELYIQVGDTPATALWTNVGPLNEGTLVVANNGTPQEVWDADGKVSVTDGFANNRLYAQASGTGTGQIMVPYASTVTANNVVQRDANGQILVPQTPTANDQAASKKYVDDHASSSPIQYQGDIIVGDSQGEESRLPIGSAGQVLTVNSTGTNLEYTDIEGVPTYTNTDAGKSLVVNSTGTDVEWQAIGAPANMVTTDTQQTISGIKTMKYLYINSGLNTDGSIRLGCGTGTQLAYMNKITGKHGTGSNSALTFNLRDSQSGESLSTLTYNNASISVDTANTCDLGASGKAWKDIYFDGYLKSTGAVPHKLSDLASINYVNNYVVPTSGETADGGTLSQLDIGGTIYDIPSGGGSSYTFANGLTESSGTVTAGGALTSNIDYTANAQDTYGISLNGYSGRTNSYTDINTGRLNLYKNSGGVYGDLQLGALGDRLLLKYESTGSTISSTQKWTYLKSNANVGAGNTATITLPSTTGTLALTSDITNYVVANPTGTATETLTSVNVGGTIYNVGGGGGTPTNMVTTNTSQTITGAKTFNSTIKMRNNAEISLDNECAVYLGRYNDVKNVWIQGKQGSTGVASYVGIYVGDFAGSTQKEFMFSNYDGGSFSSAGSNLGTSSSKWKNLYLSGVLSDGTNSVSIADLAALITYAKGQGWIN